MGVTILGLWLDKKILRVFSNLNDYKSLINIYSCWKMVSYINWRIKFSYLKKNKKWNCKMKIPKLFKRWLWNIKTRKKKVLLWRFEIQIVQISLFTFWRDWGQIAVFPSFLLKEISQHWSALKEMYYRAWKVHDQQYLGFLNRLIFSMT